MTRDSRVRVLHVITRLNVGGIATQVLGLCSGLDPRRYDVALATGHVDTDEVEAWDFLPTPRHPVFVIDGLTRAVGGTDLRAFLELWRLVRRWRPDIVHTHAAKAGALGRLAAWGSGVPVRVHSFHGHAFQGYFSPLVSRGVVAVERLLGRVTNAVIVPGRSQRYELGCRFGVAPISRILVVPYGVDVLEDSVSPSRADARRRLGLAGPLVVGAIGRMAPVKNQTMLLEVAACLRAQPDAPRFELLFVGGGECRASLERRVDELGLREAVRFCGWQESLVPIHAAIDVLALTSLNEGMPIAAIEAMAAGVAVVATSVGGVTDLVRDGETGWLAPSGDVPAFAAALRRALENGTARSRVTARARAYVEAHHTFPVACVELATIYESLLKRAGRKARTKRPLPATVVSDEKKVSRE